MNVTLCSSFRTATDYLQRYFQQAQALDNALLDRGDTLRFVWGEGDSQDGTLTILQLMARELGNAEIVNCRHGGPVFGSIESKERFAQLAGVANTIWAAIPDDTDAVIFVESDLIWDTATMIGLLDGLTVYPAVAPMIMDSPPKVTYYDVWGSRRNGLRFTKRPPHHPDIVVGQMLKMDSAGSCIAIRWKLAQGLYFPPEDCFVGLCRLLHEQGGEIWLDTNLTVHHP